MSTLDDFFGPTEASAREECEFCGATEDLIGVGYNAQTDEYSMYTCKACRSKREQEDSQAAQKRDAAWNSYLEYTEE